MLCTAGSASRVRLEISMARGKSCFVCSECGHSSSKWLGKCPNCSTWDSLVEEAVTGGTHGHRRTARDAQAVPITAITADTGVRMSTGLHALDGILGGGLVAGSAVLISGEPGVGKSTLLLQVAHGLSEACAAKTATLLAPTLYITAEESAMQLRLRAERLAAISPRLQVLAENSLARLLGVIEELRPGAVIVDSIQMVYWEDLGSAPGSVGQVRECAAALIAQAKRLGYPVFLVGHVTKDGSIAGPKVLEHMVDVVLSFEGDRFHTARILRASKNRFGAVNEIGVFEMSSDGLRPVDDPSRLFLSGTRGGTAGTVITAPLSGSRPFLVEVQALVAPALPGNARRRVAGVDPARSAMLLAVLEKRCDLILSDKDVFLNVVGGAELREPGADVALALAVAGSLQERALPADTVAIGEVGLGGEVRPIAQVEARLLEAARLGFRRVLLPAGSRFDRTPLETQMLRDIEDALALLET